MSDAVPAPYNEFSCTQCGGELHPNEGQVFITCPYCASTVYLDRSRVVFHWYLAPTLDEDKARTHLARWMGGNDTVKDLDRKALLAGSAFEFFPFWYFKSRDKSGVEQVWLEPAAATSVSELKQMNIPAGDLRKYDDAITPQAQVPTNPLPTVMNWLTSRLEANAEVVETALVHVPVYTFKYTFKEKTYTAIVEGATGRVFANIFPAKAEAPFLLVGCLTAIIALCLANIPVLGVFLGYWDGAAIGLGICTALGFVISPFLFFLARWVAAKV